MLVKTVSDARLTVVIITITGTNLTYPAGEMLNSWLELADYKCFYISRSRRGKAMQTEFTIA